MAKKRDESYAARREYIKQWARKRYWSSKGKRCVYCWKPWTNRNRVYCDACAERLREGKIKANRESRIKWEGEGRCKRCAQPLHPEADVGNKVCFPCRVNSSLHKRFHS